MKEGTMTEPTTLSKFWDVIDAQIEQLTTAKSADEVIDILAKDKNPYGDPDIASGDGFFAGSGGDATVWGALAAAGWKTVWYEADYHFAMRAPDGSGITYVEGDIYGKVTPQS